ncbi:MAG: hypothetical protein BWZ03_00861 [bacterium ADurb.BinA186]|nr:MAG: hypothetical protein BWZ03_00861 [bacterium ADurb.BinA186]
MQTANATTDTPAIGAIQKPPSVKKFAKPAIVFTLLMKPKFSQTM